MREEEDHDDEPFLFQRMLEEEELLNRGKLRPLQFYRGSPAILEELQRFW